MLYTAIDESVELFGTGMPVSSSFDISSVPEKISQI